MGEEPKERTYWLSRPAAERFQALENLRQRFYDNASERVQRVYRVIEARFWFHLFAFTTSCYFVSGRQGLKVELPGFRRRGDA